MDFQRKFCGSDCDKGKNTLLSENMKISKAKLKVFEEKVYNDSTLLYGCTVT